MGRVSIVLFTTGPGALWWLFDVEVFEILFIERLQANGPAQDHCMSAERKRPHKLTV